MVRQCFCRELYCSSGEIVKEKMGSFSEKYAMVHYRWLAYVSRPIPVSRR